jgi:hypothetical protein
MNRGQDVITESERLKKMQQRLEELEVEEDFIKRERDTLTNENKILKEDYT